MKINIKKVRKNASDHQKRKKRKAKIKIQNTKYKMKKSKIKNQKSKIKNQKSQRMKSNDRHSKKQEVERPSMKKHEVQSPVITPPSAGGSRRPRRRACRAPF
ncbi:MAG: hypothetical protein LBP95_11570, partial [Deltaproteobacteria bacterium]|nr:hypothetical protein [Deltaproteobacteria bacterium]